MMVRSWREAVMVGLVAVGLSACGHGAARGDAAPRNEAPVLSMPMPPPAPPPPVASPAPIPTDFPGWLDGFRAEARARGLKPETLAVLDGVQPIDRVLELDRKQPEFTLTFDQYLARAINPKRVAQGRALLAQHAELLRAVSDRYGVPPAVIVAMWGIETDFGRATGGFQVLPALVTLAYDGRRSQYFRGELLDALTIIDHGVPAGRLRGSWAGAMGQCQFMPSTYLKYARSWDGQDLPDIWNEPSDVFASAANYLSGIGWDRRQGWGHTVSLPADLDPTLIGLDTKRSVAEWSRLGITQADGQPLRDDPAILASVVRAETGKNGDVGQGPPYLVTDNFRVFMKWNHSTFFALAAGTLADSVASR